MHCRATGALYETAARTREFHFLSMSFDGAHERWIVPLIHGGAIILTDRTPWPKSRRWTRWRAIAPPMPGFHPPISALWPKPPPDARRCRRWTSIPLAARR